MIRTYKQLQTERGYDVVKVYQCMDSTCASTLELGSLSGTISSAQSFTSSTGYLFLKFTSDGSVQKAGWVASWASIVSAMLQGSWPCYSCVQVFCYKFVLRFLHIAESHTCSYTSVFYAHSCSYPSSCIPGNDTTSEKLHKYTWQTEIFWLCWLAVCWLHKLWAAHNADWHLLRRPIRLSRLRILRVDDSSS